MPMTQIDHDATNILRILANAPRDAYTTGPELATQCDLTPERINDAVTLLVEAGHADWTESIGTAPYDFGDVALTSRGRYESQRLAQSREALESAAITPSDAAILSPVPVGSPYGFTEEDWETVAAHKGRQDCIYTVLGHQFDSKHFDSKILRMNVESMMRAAVCRYNSRSGRDQLSCEHKNLSAGYGEHLFNEIARDIIGADIAICEVSDLNPNVMLEMGVALTWGVWSSRSRQAVDQNHRQMSPDKLGPTTLRMGLRSQIQSMIESWTRWSNVPYVRRGTALPCAETDS